jgi:dihydroorotase
MSADIVLFNGKLLADEKVVDGCVAITKGRISYVGRETYAPQAKERVNVERGLILPGLIDVHTHLRDLCLSEKEDFNTGTRSALAGGFTTVLDMPNSKPVTDTSDKLAEKMDLAKSKIVSNLGFFGAFDSTLKQVKKMVQLGVIGFKIYANKIEPFDGEDDRLIENALLYAKQENLPVAFHAEDLKTIERLETRFKEQGENSLRAFALSHPPMAEVRSVGRLLSLAQKTGTHVHFCHISTPESLKLVSNAKVQGISVTCEASPHHLLLSDEVVAERGSITIVDPPLRTRGERLGLFDGLVHGQIDCIASDHAPHTLGEKTQGMVWNIPPGFPGLETTLPMMLTAFNKGMIPLKLMVETLTEKPAELFGLQGKGVLSKGFDGDVTVVDTTKRFIIDPDDFQSKAKYSPFADLEAIGRASKVFIKGRLAMDEGRILSDPGSASVILRGRSDLS